MQYFPQSECYDQSFIGAQSPFRRYPVQFQARPWYSSSDMSPGLQGYECPLGYSGLDFNRGLGQRYYGRQNIGRGGFTSPVLNALERRCYENQALNGNWRFGVNGHDGFGQKRGLNAIDGLYGSCGGMGGISRVGGYGQGFNQAQEWC
ncbi:hypothetical protein BCR33DRAFT_850820 [Rhizoclosmatium globosum]|uniref:Uncharacterized protein n=1 Tax=Rhizoclosmatium globosum TaxID=329046 RepID=A0A1Y2CAY9_9FUNG|nr:hypothetical protein BCR33DRAFT_850820 [Rhizoclosmatium globosum]|eukprot:ORY44211.1 hypothetical protein BCR33DRAFT_850820 [Rhizoclosmatium globosum]